MADTPRAIRKNALTTYLWVAAFSGLVGFGAVYVTLDRSDNAGPVSLEPPSGAKAETGSPPAGAALPSGPGSNPLSKGDMAAFVFKKVPEPLPDVAFVDGAGQPRTLRDWQGKVVLLNLWATWCAPCRKEMPGLDRLEKELGGDGFEVVALAVDRAGSAGAKKFLDEIKADGLKLYADPQARAGAALKVIGMPTTLLLDRNGREIGRLVGPAEWDKEDARKLLQAALGPRAW